MRPIQFTRPAVSRIAKIALALVIFCIPLALAVHPAVSNALVMASIIAVCPMVPALILDAVKGE